MMTGPIKDSSIWFNPSTMRKNSGKDPYIRIGIIYEVKVDSSNSDVRYLVEVQDRNDKIYVNCRMMRRFGGVFNYEDIVDRGYQTTAHPDQVNNFSAKAGDVVLVAFLNGEAREGIILGGLTHPARDFSLNPIVGPQYHSVFNGIDTMINSDGEMTVTFNGQPTNLSALSGPSNSALPDPVYDTAIGSSFYKFDKTGSFEINDNASNGGFQNVRVDKANGFIVINSGQVSLKMTKSSQAVDMTCKDLAITASNSITDNTDTFMMSATTSASIKSPKVAFGANGIELLDQLSQLIDAIGTITPISPVGPCSPLNSTPEWSMVESIQTKIKEITGSV